eukprot:g14433.t1 g14433   contig9:1826223-1827768(+)
MDEIVNITLFHPPTSRTDAISLPSSTTTISDLANFATALLDLESGEIVIRKDGVDSNQTLYHSLETKDGEGEERTLSQCGIENGDLLSVYTVSEAKKSSGGEGQSPKRKTARTGGPSAAGTSGRLDFSALLGASSASHRASHASSNSSSKSTSNHYSSKRRTVIQHPRPTRRIEQQQQLNLLGSIAATSRMGQDESRRGHLPQSQSNQPNEINGDISQMATIWRETRMKSHTLRFLQQHEKVNKEDAMRKRLEANPMDEEANKYFGEKIRLDNVQKQYEQMMEEYPESMGRVLMLYINCTVKDKPLQVFVDSGAQMTIMSSVCADRLGLLHLVDNRFEGTAVGVGTGKILGKIHIVDMTIGGYDFPCSITVMDSKSGLGDENMDCLFGLDMLKRHRCSIDLAKNALIFPVGSSGDVMVAPFLHEKDLPVAKGGTLGFDAERKNAEIEAHYERLEKAEESGKSGGGKSEEKEGDGDGKSEDTMDESK